MIEGYIIDKLKRDKEKLEREQWQPIPLPLEEYEAPVEHEEQQKKPETPSRRGEFEIEMRLADGMNGYPTPV